jgi:hypothetical protein
MATLTVKDADVTYETKNVGVEILAPLAVAKSYRIEPTDNILSSLTVIGPPDKIEEMKNFESLHSKSMLAAALPVEDPSLAQNPKSVPLIILHLPDGVRLLGPPPTMNFNVTRLNSE